MGEWYSFNDQMHRMFGGKVYRLSLSAGCTCPNRDGTLSEGGCIFCGEGGSGDFAASPQTDLKQQIEEAKQKVAGKIGPNTKFAGYMAYFQSFTNTYGDTGRLLSLFEEAVRQPDIVSLAVATRPDCLGDAMLDGLSGINLRKPVFVELGLQTIHADTAAYINRCYELSVFEEAFCRLKAAGLRVVVHMIIGLPGEDAARTRETVDYLARLQYKGAFDHGKKGEASARYFIESAANPGGLQNFAFSHIDGIKLQLLHVLRGTQLAKLLPETYGMLPAADGIRPRSYICLKDGMHLPYYTLEEYASLVRELIALLPDDIAVHRVTGDPPKRLMILPAWTADKKRVLNTIRNQAGGGNRSCQDDYLK